MNAQEKDRQLAENIRNRQPQGLPCVTTEQTRTLRRAQLTLHRWAELECNGEREVVGGQAWVTASQAPHYVRKTANLEAGALRRIAKVCEASGLHYYHQTDPRGCALFVSAEVLTSQNYSSKGIACL